MLTRVVFLLFLSSFLLVGSREAVASSATVECGPAILLAQSIRRGFLDSRLVSLQARFVKSLLLEKDTPLRFEVAWVSGKGYLIEPRFRTWMAVNGKSLEVALSDASGEPVHFQLLIPEQFRKSSFLDYFKAPTQAQRRAFYDWYVSQVGPRLIAEKWKQMASLMKSGNFTWESWVYLTEMIERFAPQGIVLQSDLPPYDRFRLGVVRHEDDTLRITFHLWTPDAASAHYRFGIFFESWAKPVCDENWKTIESSAPNYFRTTSFQSCKLQGELFSIAQHRELLPQDTLSDLLSGLNAKEGGYLLDLYPHFGSFSMNETDEGAMKWKHLLETAIVTNSLQFVPQN